MTNDQIDKLITYTNEDIFIWCALGGWEYEGYNFNNDIKILYDKDSRFTIIHLGKSVYFGDFGSREAMGNLRFSIKANIDRRTEQFNNIFNSLGD